MATHSGYFILRQFLNFTGARRGKRSNLFARKVLTNGHASVRDYMGHGSIYHLFSRTLYGQIEKGNLRNRRKHSFEYIRTRLACLISSSLILNPSILKPSKTKSPFSAKNWASRRSSFQARSMKAGREAVLPFANSWISSPSLLSHLSPVLPCGHVVLRRFRPRKYGRFSDTSRSLPASLTPASGFSLPLYLPDRRPIREGNGAVPRRREATA